MQIKVRKYGNKKIMLETCKKDTSKDHKQCRDITCSVYLGNVSVLVRHVNDTIFHYRPH